MAKLLALEPRVRLRLVSCSHSHNQSRAAGFSALDPWGDIRSEMTKLYRSSGSTIHYWETWAEDDRRHIVHWGELGTRGTSKIVKSTFLRKARHIVQKEIDERLQQGYQPIPDENHAILMIEYAVDGFGSSADLDKRHRLEQRMNETLGWTGLGT